MNEFPAPCDLRIVSNGVELLEYFTVRRNRDGVKSNPVPDLIILDLNMPGMDGRQAIRKLRGAQFDATIPVIVFSTSDSAKDISDSYRAGCNSYVIKPTDLEHFNQVLAMITFYWLEVAALP